MDRPAAERGGDLGVFLDAALRIVDLPLEPELRPRVLMHLETAAHMASLVTSFPMSDEAEPAPVFVP